KKEIISKIIEDKLNEFKGKEKLEKENNEKYDEIKQNIDKFLTPESLDNYFKENIDSIDENYLTNNRNKLSLNNFYNEKQNLLTEKLKEIENQNYLDILTKENQENWYISGLTTKECEIAINNGWNIDSNNKIINKYIKHRNFKKIDVLKIKKSELDKSLDILDKILEKERNTFKSLPEDFKNVSITELNDEYLPRGAKQKDLLKAIKDKRNTFRYKINEPNNEDDNDGLDPNKYDKILNLINETHEWEFERWKNKVTPEFLNNFLADFLQREGDENLVEKNLDGWLKGDDPLQNQDKLTG
ncbi:3243_t:CDS:2, partial [Cetraspora pellucida]